MSDKPNLVIDEPTATGWQRTELYGDRDKAKNYVNAARTQLGGMRSMYGVNERIANHEPGGHYHQWATLDDGTKIHTITNDGHDTVRIYAASTPPSPSEKEEKEDDTKPYLWVGVRIKWDASRTSRFGDSGVPYDGLLAFIAEPDGEGGIKNGLVYPSPNTGWSTDTQANLASGEPELEISFLGADGLSRFRVATLNEGVAEHQSLWSSQHTFPLGVHNFSFFDSVADSGSFCFSKSGLKGFDYTNARNYNTLVNDFLPYDPMLNADEQQGERNFGANAQAIIEESGFDALAWDTVFVIDPEEGNPVYTPTDEREGIAAANQAFYRAGMAEGDDQILPGLYLLNIGAYGEQQVISSRNGEAVATLNPNIWRRTNEADFSDYRTLTSLSPMTVEVEVRLGKEPFMDIFNFELAIGGYETVARAVYPYGEDSHLTSVCQDNVGPNPHGNNWYPQTIAIDVENKTAELSNNLPDGVFVPSGFNYSVALGSRYPLEVYVHGDYGVSQVSAANYADYAALTIAQMLDEMTTGIWGPNIEIRERLYSDIVGAANAAAISHGFVWLYNVQANSFTPLPIVSALGDYDYTDQPDGFGGTFPSTYKQHLYWFYPYRVQARRRCSKVFAVLLQAAISDAIVETGNTNQHDEPAGTYDVPACCPETFFGS